MKVWYIDVGIRYRIPEERDWRRNGFSVFSPPSLALRCTTHMLELWVLQMWVSVSGPTNGRTKLFKITFSCEL